MSKRSMTMINLARESKSTVLSSAVAKSRKIEDGTAFVPRHNEEVSPNIFYKGRAAASSPASASQHVPQVAKLKRKLFPESEAGSSNKFGRTTGAFKQILLKTNVKPRQLIYSNSRSTQSKSRTKDRVSSTDIKNQIQSDTSVSVHLAAPSVDKSRDVTERSGIEDPDKQFHSETSHLDMLSADFPLVAPSPDKSVNNTGDSENVDTGKDKQFQPETDTSTTAEQSCLASKSIDTQSNVFSSKNTINHGITDPDCSASDFTHSAVCWSQTTNTRNDLLPGKETESGVENAAISSFDNNSTSLPIRATNVASGKEKVTCTEDILVLDMGDIDFAEDVSIQEAIVDVVEIEPGLDITDQSNNNDDPFNNNDDDQLRVEVASDNSVVGPRWKRNNPARPPPVGTKRISNPSSWVKNQAKAAKNAGHSYTNSKGKLVPEKNMKLPCNRSCRLKCYEKISEEARMNVHNNFYRTKDQNAKWQFIRILVDSTNPARPTDKDNPKRKTRKYHFLVNGEKVEVCQPMFLNTLVISDFMVMTALNRNPVSPDHRGGKRAKHAVPESVHKSISDHIATFPRVASHYCRADTSFEYLEADLKNVSNLYELYKKWMEGKQEKKATKRQYEDDFNNNHRIKFHQPRKDRCDDCVSYDLNKATFNEDQLRAYETHILAKDLAQALSKQDKKDFTRQKDPETVLCHVDLQKVFLLPKTNASEAYYKCKLSVLNFTIKDISANQGHCYVWDETVAKKDANALASHVLSFISKKVPEGKKTFIIWSDNAGCQNKNRYLFSMYLLASAKYGIRIIHRYLVRGHTQNDADSMHARIEAAGKGINLFIPEQWCQIMDTAKVTGNPYVVNRVLQADIMDFHPLADQLLSWPSNARWNDLSEVIVDHNQAPWDITVKYDLGDTESTKLRVKSKAPGRPVNLITYQPKNAFSSPIPITHKKRKHLMELCRKVIPQEHIGFYESLKCLNAEEERDDDFYLHD